MSEVGPSRRSTGLWYCTWSAMLLLAFYGALTSHPFLSGKVNLCAGMLLAVVAAVPLLLRRGVLPRKEAALSAVLLAIFFVAQLVHFAVSLLPAEPHRGVDFSAYYLAGKVVSEKPPGQIYVLPKLADGRTNLNTETAASSPWSIAAGRYKVPYSAPYIYPPLLATLMKPMVHLPFAWAYQAWNLTTLVLVASSVLLALKLGGVRFDSRLALILGVGLFSYYPLIEHLFVGQIGVLILFLTTLGVWLLSRSRMGFSALCFAIATAIKLTPVLALPVLLFHRKWKWIAAYALWLVALLLFSIWQAGWPAHVTFWREALPSISKGVPVCQNLSVTAFVQELFLGYVPLAQGPSLTIPHYSGPVSKLVALAIYLGFLLRFYLRRHEGELVRDLAVMALLGILISPISWVHHYTMALLPFVYLWCKQQGRVDRALLLLFLAVGTDVIEFVQFSVTNHLIQLMLAAVVPGLTLIVVYRALAPGAQVDPANVPAEAHSPLLAQ